MRDPDRIPRILLDLSKAWRANPDLRLGQLIVNLLGKDPFYIEDDEAHHAIKAVIEGTPEQVLAAWRGFHLEASGSEGQPGGTVHDER